MIGGRLPDGEDGSLMPSTPFDAAHQESLRELIGRVLPGAGAQHIAEAVAAGYGYRTHRAFLKAIRAVQAGDPAPVHDFDAGRLIGRLQALGEPVDEQEAALRFLLTVMADGPRSGPPPKQDPPDEALARQHLRTGRLYMDVGLWHDAGTILGTAMDLSPASVKGEVAAALERAAPHAEIATLNFALALVYADGMPRNLVRAGALLEPLTRVQEPALRSHAHNWLAHIASGRLGGSPAPAAALSHFEQAARLGHAEAAFNAGLLYESGNGTPPSKDKACELYRRAIELGHVPSMTNLACKIVGQDRDEALDLLEQAAAAGDEKASGLLRAITESGVTTAFGDSFALEEDRAPPQPVRVVPSGTRRPKAIVAALRKAFDAPAKDMQETVAFMLGFGSWCEMVQAATKNKADPPDEECGAAEVLRRRAYQSYALAECSEMGPVAASIAVDALRPTAEAGRPVLDQATLERMRDAWEKYAEALGDEDLDDEDDLDDLDVAGELAAVLGSVMEVAGVDPHSDPMNLLDALRLMHPIQPDVWLGLMEEHLGWVFTDVDEDAEQDGDQVAVAVGSPGRRVPVFMSAVAYIPGDLSDAHVARLKADIGAAHPAGAVLVFNRPAGWLPEQGGGGLVYGGLLWSDKTWSDFVLRPGGGLEDALSHRGRNLVHPDAPALAALGFAGASGVLHSLAAYLEGFEPDEVDVKFLRSASGWLMPLATPA